MANTLAEFILLLEAAEANADADVVEAIGLTGEVSAVPFAIDYLAKTDYVAADIDDGGTIDGTEAAAVITTISTKINEILDALIALGFAAEAE
jgi:hypothetical protein